MLGIIGAGNMGMALASRVKGKILLSDKNKRISDNVSVTRRSDVIILAVKPQDIGEVLKDIKPYVKGKLIISIAAGVTTSSIEKVLGKVAVVRVMPNMPAMVGKGISAVTPGRFAGAKDLETTTAIFSKVGEVVKVKEGMMDAVTAVSGSGPAYYFLFTHLLAEAGESAGLEKNLAMKLARAVLTGAAEAAAYSDIDMEEFVKKVASKGGTTEAALKVFKQENLGAIIKKAVKRAARRSGELEERLCRK
ncbi:MAG: pyrroline-5-carboxylate reductase [Candidatus Omnitrophota bacterium]|jgi:pyrroline-5-carboxylate reductase